MNFHGKDIMRLKCMCSHFFLCHPYIESTTILSDNNESISRRLLLLLNEFLLSIIIMIIMFLNESADRCIHRLML